MVRFARAVGSKGSNKRELEEPTPWSELVVQHIEKAETGEDEERSKKKKKKDHPDEIMSMLRKEGGRNIKQQVEESLTSAIKLKEQTEEECEVVQEAPDKSEGEKKKKKKKKKKKDQENFSDKAQLGYIVNSKGQRLKVFKDGTERTWFDLPYEENERMTRYKNMWVKREMVEKLDQLQASLQDAGLDEIEVMRKMMKAKRKAHKDLRAELIYEQKSLVNDQNAIEAKNVTKDLTEVNKQGKKSKENKGKSHHVKSKVYEMFEKKEFSGKRQEMMSDNFASNEEKKDIQSKVHHILDGEENEGKKDIQSKVHHIFDDEENEEKKDIQSKVHHIFDEENEEKKDIQSKAHLIFDDGENIRVQLKDFSMDKSKDIKSTLNRNGEIGPEKNSETFRGDFQRKKKTQFCDFEENDMMTQYEGIWVRREVVERLNAVKAEKLQCIYAARAGTSSAEELTRGEQITLQRIMKKEKRFEHRQLTMKLAKLRLKREGKWPGAQNTMRRGGNIEHLPVKNYSSSKSHDSEVVRFDGFWVKKESADRLNRLKERLMSEGVSEEELKKVMQKERRLEERILKNERKLLCLKCRKPGHMVSDCPELVDANEGQTTICYICGSTEHISQNCSLKRKGAEYSYATCFICGEVGHISRECPDNPRGLYPNGGACRGCGSVEHFAKDCPDKQVKYEESNIRLNRIDKNAVEALDIEEPPDASWDVIASPKKVKVVKF